MLNQPILETKYFSEIKQISASNCLIKGYASVFDIVDSHNDLIVPNAFDESITRHNNSLTVKLLWQHNHQEPIGSIDTLYTDNIGLIMSANINTHTQRGREIIALIQQKAINGLSIGFKVVDHHYKNGVRVITKAHLWEISVVTFPANEQAQISSLHNKNTILSPNLYQSSTSSTESLYDLTSSCVKALNNITKLNNLKI